MERQSMNISQWVYWLERDSLLLAYYSEATDKFSSPSETGKKVHLFYIARPDKYLLSGESPERDGWGANDTYLNVSLDSNIEMTDASFWGQENDIPEQFHEALVARVIANGYERQAETLQLASYFINKYEVGVKEAKKYSYRGRDGSAIVISGGYDF
jgi:hypothetical protein|tara:strand:- start:117 stop:587 length:471 start_codon:yes stop_codon:yes gene_type:complete